MMPNCEVQTNTGHNGALISRLDQRIVELTRHSNATFENLAARCLGAWPGLVATRLQALDLWGRVGRDQAQLNYGPSYEPELHPRTGEWYFTGNTALELVSEFLSPKAEGMLLGVPTIAKLATEKRKPYCLYDSNALLRKRFPTISPFLRIHDIQKLLSAQKCGVVIMDPPWYPSIIRNWLQVAYQFCEPNGLIVMPLLAEFTRPNASAERASILEFAERLGRSTLALDCVAYETPLFEATTLASLGLYGCSAWRKADMLVIRKRGASNLALASSPESETKADDWVRFVIGNQVVDLRRRRERRATAHLMTQIDGVHGYQLDSVSARDPRREAIDIWSSRNRVAAVGNNKLMADLLRRLSTGGTPNESVVSGLSGLRSIAGRDDVSALAAFLQVETAH